jgi:tRNA-uridine 2-sulfurtransferase
MNQQLITNFMPPPGSKILIAMSGGVDSAAAAAILVEAGYQCMGGTLRMTDDKASSSSVYESCCGLQAAEDARHICEQLNIPHRTIRVVEKFEKHIINYFAEEYIAGRTPNPCIRCNRMIKFGLLFCEARNLGYDFVAMGHYARLSHRNERIALRKAAYLPKDQSYVLAPLTQSQLRRACFPLGELTKEEARSAAGRVNDAIGKKKESQEICFVSDRNYLPVIESHAGVGAPGYIRDLAGNILGTHKGIHAYTIGQRKGLGISAEKPLYVVRIDPSDNTVYVGRDEQSFTRHFSTGPLFWGAIPPQKTSLRAYVQIRYKHIPVLSEVTPFTNGANVVMDIPQKAITPGQWAVFYDEDGFIDASAIIQQYDLID